MKRQRKELPVRIGGIDMADETIIFRATDLIGREYTIWADGRFSGFSGCKITNSIPAMWSLLQSLVSSAVTDGKISIDELPPVFADVIEYHKAEAERLKEG